MGFSLPGPGLRGSKSSDGLSVNDSEKCASMKRTRSLNRLSTRSSDTLRDDRGWTLLHIASFVGNAKEVTTLLATGMDVNEVSLGPKEPGATALHLAASRGHLEVMDILLENGANIESRTRGVCGWTPLHYAAKRNNKEAIQYLIENGAFLSPDMADCRFNPPLHYCLGLEYAYSINDQLLDSCNDLPFP